MTSLKYTSWHSNLSVLPPQEIAECIRNLLRGIAPHAEKNGVLVKLKYLFAWQTLFLQILFFPVTEKKWTCGDLNPRPPPCKGGDLPADLQALFVIFRAIARNERNLPDFDPEGSYNLVCDLMFFRHSAMFYS